MRSCQAPSFWTIGRRLNPPGGEGVCTQWTTSHRGSRLFVTQTMRNKTNGQILKWVLQENKACQMFRKKNIFYTQIRTGVKHTQAIRRQEPTFWDSPFCLVADALLYDKSLFLSSYKGSCSSIMTRTHAHLKWVGLV